ncbi:MAG: 50S ribosomal protein L4 [Candidatus Bathyarchaeia archaeon]
MPTVEILNKEGKVVGQMDLNRSVFGVEPNHTLMHQAVLSYLANQRQGTHSTKTRGEVRGGGRKPWRQKGTGRARQGSIRAPQWVGGGVVFGPKPRDYSFYLSKNERRAALRSALSAKLADGEIVVVEELRLEEPKTKKMEEILASIGLSNKTVLIVLDETDPNVILSARNLPNVVGIIRAQDLTTYDVLSTEVVLMTKGAVEVLERRLSEEGE